MRRRRFQEIEVEPGRVLRRFAQDESIQLVEQWIGIYAKDAIGVGLKTYLWHTFSFERYPSESKGEARNLYRKQIASEVVVLSNDRRAALLTDELPTKCSHVDYCVFPANLAWTMAFTHEDEWLGPYFATHPNYESMISQEVERLRARQRKANEIERARRKGWL